MAVQVLCENAVRHGIERRSAGGVIRIEAREASGRAVITVTSPGPFGGPRPGGIGLELTRRRLALAFGDAAEFRIGSSPNASTTVAVIVVPLKPTT